MLSKPDMHYKNRPVIVSESVQVFLHDKAMCGDLEISWESFVESRQKGDVGRGGCNYALSFIERVEQAKQEGTKITKELISSLFKEADDGYSDNLVKKNALYILSLFWINYYNYKEALSPTCSALAPTT